MLKVLVSIFGYTVGVGLIILGIRAIVSFIRDIRDHVNNKKSSAEDDTAKDALPVEEAEKEVKK